MKTLIVEDEAMFREFLCGVCLRELKMESVLNVGLGESAISALNQNQIDFVILDLSLPDVDGFRVMEGIKTTCPGTKILILSAFCDCYTVYRVSQSDASGFIDKKEITISGFCDAISKVKSGASAFSPHFLQIKKKLRESQASFDKILTEREQYILSLIGRGLSDDEIAALLAITPKTARTHR